MRLAWLAIAAATVLLTLAYTAPYGAVNQATYLLDPLHRAMPELFHRDWFINQPSYMPVFGWLAQWLFRIDSEGTYAVVTAHVIVTLATYAALYRLISAVSPAWQTFLIVASFATATMDLSMGGSYLFAGYLQPSSIATLGWVAAMAALVRGRYLACGFALAGAGLLHVNFLVLGIGLFTLAALVQGGTTRRDLVKLVAPQLVVLACYAPVLFASAGPSPEALRILVDFHASAHYAPHRLVRWIPELLAWQLAAYVAIRVECLRESPLTRELRSLWRFSLVATSIVTISALVIRYAGLESLTQLFWARIGPFAQLACQIVLVGVLVRHAGTSSLRRRVALALAIVVVLVVVWRFMPRMFGLVPMLVSAAGVAIVLAAPARFARGACSVLAIAALIAALWGSKHGQGFTIEASASPNELALMTWAREHTPVDALFLASPGLGRFRLLARRAVIADLKSPPLRPDLMVQWYRRLCAMVKLPDAPTSQAIGERYDQLTAADLAEVAHSFGADYIVGSPAIQLGSPVFANEQYAVFRVIP